jgi:hypothetical protein
MMDDLALSPAEEAYFRSGGQDTDGVIAEADRGRTGPAADYGDDYSPAERAFFESAGTEVSYDLRREHGEAPQPQRDHVQLPPAAQQMLDRAIASYQGERIDHARTGARLDLLREAVAPPPAPDPEPPARPDPTQDIFAYVRDIGDRLTSYEQQIQTGQAEMAEEGAYRSALDAAVRQEPAVYHAYQHLLRSRAAELMGDRYPQATPDQLMRAPIPADINQILQSEERDLYKNAFAAQRNPVVDIVRLAQVRGWRSPQQRAAAEAAAAAEQRRQREAKAAAERREEEAEAEWRRGIARKLQYGMSMDELPRADRIRFYRGAQVFRGN